MTSFCCRPPFHGRCRQAVWIIHEVRGEKWKLVQSRLDSTWTLQLTRHTCVSPQKRAAEFDADVPPRQAPGGAPGKPSPDQPATEPQQRPSRPSAPPRSRDPNAPGMRPPKTGVGQRDKMRELLRDALALALDDVPDGQPGARTLAAASSDNLALPQETDIRLRSTNTA